MSDCYPALESLHDIREYISNAAGSDVAHRVQTEIVLQAETLLEFPLQGRQVPRIDAPEIREIIVKSYRVIYQLDSLDEPSEASIVAGQARHPIVVEAMGC